ncbi:hypothetical protein CS0771_45760 [Catellatospora sp. IY07-71]|uniref:hypothetical protein n=1 Tax=Catellatospora sp. IY07-71 TaxID=2728827 RepID=UPI001BB37514|nr:hypothetical protein [Catellatospora sp. IY07-71]BCJ75032.1 hypothetical protein CS0771_45760 [Catellatospora sp. IY07-71]
MLPQVRVQTLAVRLEPADVAQDLQPDVAVPLQFLGALLGGEGVGVHEQHLDGHAAAHQGRGGAEEALVDGAGEQTREGVEHAHQRPRAGDLVGVPLVVQAPVLVDPSLLRPAHDRRDREEDHDRADEFRSHVQREILGVLRYAARRVQQRQGEHGQPGQHGQRLGPQRLREEHPRGAADPSQEHVTAPTSPTASLNSIGSVHIAP